MYVPRIERPDKIYPVKVYNGNGDYIQYISWVELEARDNQQLTKDLKELRKELKEIE
jgi:hypothetical protein